MRYLGKNEYMPIAENLINGQKVRVNHDSQDCCGSSKSMLIEVKDDGNISAHCFRCGRYGNNSSKVTLKSKITRTSCTRSGEKSDNSTRHVPEDYIERIAEWPCVRARAWVRKYGLTDEEVLRYGIVYSPSLSRVILPTFDGGGIAGYQTRRILEDDTFPKYLSYVKRSGAMVYADPHHRSHRCVIVEDIISAIKVSRHMPCMPLLSTNIREVHVKLLIELGFKEFMIFLDDDNSTVRKEALKSQRLLSKIGKCTVYHSGGRDPKEHTDRELTDILL